MSAATPALIAAAAGVGFGHAILPDHWVPLAVVGRTRRYPLRRVAQLSGLAGVAHVLVSLVLGALIIVVGLRFRSAIQGAQDEIIGAILILTGLGFAALELTGHGHHHHDGHDHHHSHAHSHPHVHGHDQPHAHSQQPQPASGAQGSARRFRGLVGIMIPFGAAASPDLTILPVFFAATAAGTATAISSLVVFAAVTIGTIVSLTLTACFGGYQIRGQWLVRWGNTITALVLIIIGTLVLTGIV